MEATTSLPQPSQPDPSHPKTHTDPPLPNTIPLKDLSSVQEPEIDQYWEKQTGKIERKRDAAFCRHGEKAMCDYCMPLEVCHRSILVLCCRSQITAVRPQVPIGASDQAPFLPCLSPQTPLVPSTHRFFSYRSSSTLTDLSVRHHPLPYRCPPSISRRYLLHMPAFCGNSPISTIQNGRPR